MNKSTLGTFVKDALRSIVAFLDSLIYQLVAFLYKLFFYVSETEFIQSDAIRDIYRNFQLLVAVVVMFSVAISLINYIVNPDNMAKGKTPASKLVTKVVTSLVLLLTVNIIFATAYRLQSAVIRNNFVGKLILGDRAQSYNIDSMGLEFSKSILSIFVYDNPNRNASSNIPPNTLTGANQLFNEIITTEDEIPLLQEFINDKDEDDAYILNYNALSIVVGILIAYILLTYVFGVAIRVVQLFFLQIIAPVPILLYVLPNGDDKLKKWSGQCVATYLDLFIRHLIIYITIFLCTNLLSAGGSFNIPSGAADYKNWIILALVLGILLFAKKAPELIKELFPSTSKASGKFGLDLGKQFKGMLGFGLLGAGATLGKKTLAGFDALAHGEKFRAGWSKIQGKGPLNKLRTGLNTALPFSAEVRKNSENARLAYNKNQDLINKGKKIFERNNGQLGEASFKSKDYFESYSAVGEAKAAVGQANNDLEMARANLHAAYNNGGDIDAAQRAYTAAAQKAASAQGMLEYRKSQHENMKKIYVDDAFVEDAFGAYKRVHGSGATQSSSGASSYQQQSGNVSGPQPINITAGSLSGGNSGSSNVGGSASNNNGSTIYVPNNVSGNRRESNRYDI